VDTERGGNSRANEVRKRIGVPVCIRCIKLGRIIGKCFAGKLDAVVENFDGHLGDKVPSGYNGLTMGRRIGKAILIWLVLPAVFCAVGFLVVGPNIGKPPPEVVRELVKPDPAAASNANTGTEAVEPEVKPAFPEPETKLTVTRVRGNYRPEESRSSREETSSSERRRDRSEERDEPVSEPDVPNEPAVEPLPDGSDLPTDPASSDQ